MKLPELVLISLSVAAFVQGAAAIDTSKAEKIKILNCKDLQSIRDFKDIVIGTLAGTGEAGRDTANDWARGICGKSADKAGFNKVPPPDPSSVPAFPGCPKDDPKEVCAQRSAYDYFGVYLPLSRTQALKLGHYVWKDQEPSGEKSKIK